MFYKYGIFGSFLFLCYFSFLYSGGVFNNKIIPGALFGYEMVTAKLALHASLAIFHLIFNARSWNNCKLSMINLFCSVLE